uniref:carboxymuconolactone decarboxylase family protein n=1 Tax=Dyella sp. TaxID=1869338 RepID=UPI002FDB88A2
CQTGPATPAMPGVSCFTMNRLDDADTALERGNALFRQLAPDVAQHLEQVFQHHPDLLQLGVEYVYGTLHARPQLNTRDREIVSIAVITTLGGCDEPLAAHVKLGLGAGLSEQEIREVVLQCSAYAGFPRAISAMRKVLEICRLG